MECESFSAERLRSEHDVALNEQRRRPGIAARVLFLAVGWLFPDGVDYRMLRVVELVARVPYNTWSQTGFIALTHQHDDQAISEVIQDSIVESRDQDDNEAYHLLILDELLAAQGYKPTLIREQIIPQILAFVYWWLSLALYVIHPKWSHALNADFEDHATACYSQYVADYPEIESVVWESRWKDAYDPNGNLNTVGDLFRRITVDEMEHRDTSIAHIRVGARWHRSTS